MKEFFEFIIKLVLLLCAIFCVGIAGYICYLDKTNQHWGWFLLAGVALSGSVVGLSSNDKKEDNK